MTHAEYLKQVNETSRSLQRACSSYWSGAGRTNIEEIGRLQNKLRCRYGLTYAQIAKASGLPEADFDEILYLSEAVSDLVSYGDY